MRENGRIFWLAFLVLGVLGANAIANAQTVCRTYSRGLTFESRDPWYAERMVVDECMAHPRTSNNECRENVRCAGDYQPGPGPYPGPYPEPNPGPNPGSGFGGRAFIRGVNDRGYLNGSHFIELYGEFPQGGWSTNYQSEVRCNGWTVNSRVDYYSRQQINVAYSLPYDRSSCTVRVFSFNESSNTFGPLILRNYPR